MRSVEGASKSVVVRSKKCELHLRRVLIKLRLAPRIAPTLWGVAAREVPAPHSQARILPTYSCTYMRSHEYHHWSGRIQDSDKERVCRRPCSTTDVIGCVVFGAQVTDIQRDKEVHESTRRRSNFLKRRHKGASFSALTVDRLTLVLRPTEANPNRQPNRQPNRHPKGAKPTLFYATLTSC